MYCPNCGKQIAEESRFCMWCGKAMPGTEPEPPTPEKKVFNTNPAVQMKLECWPIGNIEIDQRHHDLVGRGIRLWVTLLDSSGSQTTSEGVYTFIISNYGSEPIRIVAGRERYYKLKDPKNITSLSEKDIAAIKGRDAGRYFTGDVGFISANNKVGREDFSEGTITWAQTQAKQKVLHCPWEQMAPTTYHGTRWDSSYPRVHVWFLTPGVCCFTLTR